MARPSKIGLDYFTLDCDIWSSTTFTYIRVRHGSPGICIILRLITEIYRKGYYMKWDEITKFTFLDAMPRDINDAMLETVIEDLFNVEFLNREIYDKHGILTSENIQQRYFSAKEKKVFDLDSMEYLLVSPDAISRKRENDTETEEKEVSSEITTHSKEVSSEITARSKEVSSEKENLKESKEKYRKENIKEKKIPPTPKGGVEEGFFPKFDPKSFPSIEVADTDGKTVFEIRAEEARQDREHYNYDGLVSALADIGAGETQIGMILYMSQYGKIGHPVWKILNDMRSPKCKVAKKPEYLIACLTKQQSNNTPPP